MSPPARKVPSADDDSDDDDYDESGSSEEENGIDEFENKPAPKRNVRADSDTSDDDDEDEDSGDSGYEENSAEGESDDSSEESSSPSPRKPTITTVTKSAPSPQIPTVRDDSQDYMESDLWKQLQEFKSRPASPATKRANQPGTTSTPSSPLASSSPVVASSPLASTPTRSATDSVGQKPITPNTTSSPVINSSVSPAIKAISPRSESTPTTQKPSTPTPTPTTTTTTPKTGGGLVSNSPFRSAQNNNNNNSNTTQQTNSPSVSSPLRSTPTRAKISSEPTVGMNEETPPPSKSPGTLVSRATPTNLTPVSSLPPPKQRPVDSKILAQGAALEATIRNSYEGTKVKHKVKSVEYPASPRGRSSDSVLGPDSTTDWTASISSKPLPTPPGKKPLPPPPPGTNISPYRAVLPKPQEVGSPIEVPPVKPGADYFYQDLELLKEVEEREAMKARLHQEARKPKKKINDLFSMLSKPEGQSSEALEQQKRAEQRAAQIAKEKNHTENLLSESEDLGHNELMRNKTINEIVSTERDFILDLEILQDLFYEPLLARNIISEQLHAAIFSNATLLFEINRNWLANLEKTIHLSSGPKISKCFSEMITYQKMYSDYCNNHTNATETAVKLMKKNANFRQFIEEAQLHPRANGQPFVSYLIKPVQRICKYPLLVKELVKHEQDVEEKAALERVLEKLSTVVTGINETKRDVDNMNKTLQIQKQLGIKHLELLQPGRQFVREGFFQEFLKDGDVQMIYLALFSDLLLRGERRRAKFGTMRRNDRYHFTDQVPLYRAEITNIPNTADYVDAIKIKFTKRTSIVITTSAAEKKEWLLDIQRLLINLDPSQVHSPELKPQPELQVRARGHTRSQSIGTPPISSPSTLVSSPISIGESPSTPNVSSQEGAKIKCYVGKGTPQQRIRKVSLAGVANVAQLLETIRMEFEWAPGSQFCLSYEDPDGDVIEISSSISIWDILTESKCFFVTNLQQPDSPSL